MPNYKISQLTTATAVSATNQFEINQNAASRSLEVSVLSTYIRSGDSGKAIVVSVSTASDALRITQTGTGNALVVEDSTNPDSSPFVIDQFGAVVVGGTSSSSATISGSNQFAMVGTTAAGAKQGLSRWDNSTGPFSVQFAKSRSGTIGTQTVVSSGDSIAQLEFFGSDGTAFIEAARITAAVDGTPGTNDMPGRLVFSTTADGASTPTERMRIDNIGRIGINSTALTGYQFRIAGTYASTDVNPIWLGVNGTIPSTATGQAYGFFSGTATQAATFTLTGLNHFFASQGGVGAGSTLTNQYGFRANSNLTGATNNYGFYSDIASGTGRWNFYANGTADNYFAGQVQLGAGTAAAPALSTTGDTNTGIFFPAADTIAFSEGGAEVMRIDSSGNFLFNSGYGSAATAYGCRAWVNFNGTGTVAIRASGNVTSITDNGTGQYTMNFTTALPDANYSAAAASFVAGTAIIVRTISFATTSLSLNTTNSAASDVDASTVSIAIFR
jgi:hypothetical protein